MDSPTVDVAKDGKISAKNRGIGRATRENAFQIGKSSQSRRSRSFSNTLSSSSLSSSSSFGSSSFSSNTEDSSCSSIASLQFGGVPFSWEQHPGVPKKSSNSHYSTSKIQDLSTIMLPLPPASTPIPSKRFDFDAIFPIRKKVSHESLSRDPFIAALMKCSRDHNRTRELEDDCWKSEKASRTLGYRFGFIDLHASCKKTCDVSESKVLLPRSSRVLDRQSE